MGDSLEIGLGFIEIVKGKVMKRVNVINFIGAFSLMFAMSMHVGCGMTRQLSQQLPSMSQCTFNCQTDKVLASETTLGRCTLFVVDRMCVATINPGGCKGDPNGFKVLLQNQSGTMVKVRHEALQGGKWGAHWGEKREIQPGGSYEWGIAATHGTGVRFVCP